jgi:(R,R)-butanediol dehydrogenase/meso-butanediol dehydrogenase/diacetyl reductase
MRAGVLYRPHDLRIEALPDPACGDDDVVIEVGYNGLCGTDATEFSKGPMMVPLMTPHPATGHVGPTILGHEFVGAVVEAGKNVRSLLGKRVACGAGVWCGSCRRCLAGRTNLCGEYYTLGLSTHGGLAEFVRAPARTCLEIPDGCADLDAALAQPLAVGIHAVRRACVRPGDTVVLLGAGAIGSFILCALNGHDGPIIAIDVDAARLEVAVGLGATYARLIDPDVTAAQLRDLLPGGADVVLETSGAFGGAERACALTVQGGTVLLVGLNKTPQPLNLADLVLREINIYSTVAHVCDQDMPRALALLAERRLSARLLDRVVPLDEVVAAGLEPLTAGVAKGKILVAPRRG